MKMTKMRSMRLLAISAAAVVAGAAAPVQAAAPYADILLVVDESGSMGGAHAWLQNLIPDLEAGILAQGVGVGNQNRYALVGFGQDNPNNLRFFNPSGTWVDSTTIVGAGYMGNLVAVGGTSPGEDGFLGIASGLGLGHRANAAFNIILVTDEDRDVVSGDTYNSVLTALQAQGGILNAVVNAQYTTDYNSGNDNGFALGILGPTVGDPSTVGYVPDGSGGYIIGDPGTVLLSTQFGTTQSDYVSMALATGGGAWDIQTLRNNNPLTVESFSTAFVDIKVQEITQQTPVPEGETWLAMAPLAAFGMWVYRRRQQRAAA